jgi:hypothetical protein
MSHPANPFRLAYRSFDRVVFERIKSDNLFALRGFDLAYAGHAFPGYVLERPASAHPAEARFQVLAELGGTVLLLVYTRMGRACRLLSGWAATPEEAALWFHAGLPKPGSAEAAQIHAHDPRGRCDPRRLGHHNVGDVELRPEVTPADLDATQAELALLLRRMAPRHTALAAE